MTNNNVSTMPKKVFTTFFTLSLLTQGFGNHLFSISFFTDISTLFLYLLFLTLFISNKLIFPIHLLYLFIVIFIHSFIFNFNNKFLFDSFLHFLGVIVYSLSIFSFCSLYKKDFENIIYFIYKFSYLIALTGIAQLLLFLFFGLSFIPVSILSNLDFNEKLAAEVFGFLPRVTAFSYEPSHYAIMLLPGIYISALNLTNKIKNKFYITKLKSLIILIGFLCSFSFVGFIGLLLVIFFISRKYFKGSFNQKFIVYGILSIIFFIYAQTSLVYKLESTFRQAGMISEIDTYKYTSSDNTAFSLISNTIVAANSLRKSYYLGTGINTHKNTYDATIYNDFSFGQFEIELNKKDAGSLIIRLFSEFGIYGFLFFVFLIFRNKIKNTKTDNLFVFINHLSFVMILSYSLRNGGYLSIFLNVFCALYYYSYKENNNKNSFDYK